jgi:hypothetical protein
VSLEHVLQWYDDLEGSAVSALQRHLAPADVPWMDSEDAPSASAPLRAETLQRLRAKVEARITERAVTRTKDDLIQLQYGLAERELARAVRADLEDHRQLDAAHLDVADQDVSILDERLGGPYEMPVLRLIREQLARHPDVEVGGANPTNPASWQRVEIGDVAESIPKQLSIYWDAGTVSAVPLVLCTWTNGGRRTLSIRSHPSHQEHARAYIDQLLADARGPGNPFRGRLLQATWNGEFKLTVLPEPVEDRTQLVLPDGIWTALDYNVHRMFDRMDRFRAAGLGSNRGVLLAGPPGTGKTAACRVLAAEVIGDATAVFVQSQVGQHLLHQLYQEVAGLGPTLVLLEDLDLLTGSRDERTARAALFDFLTVLDGLMTRHHDVITVATTNDPAAIDAAVRRAARFDQVVTFPMPDRAARERILDVYLAALDHDVNIGAAARRTEGMSGAGLRELVRSALLAAEGSLTTDDIMAQIPKADAHGSDARSTRTDHAGGSRYM